MWNLIKQSPKVMNKQTQRYLKTSAYRNRLWTLKVPRRCLSTYIREADGAVPLHRFFDYIQSSVVPAGQLEAQRPVGGDERMADELEAQWIDLSIGACCFLG